jgi:hypothetical protein
MGLKDLLRSPSCIIKTLLLCGAVGLTLTGLFCMVVFPPMFNSILQSKLTILPGGQAFDQWIKPSLPTTIKFYLWSVQNPNEVMMGEKPKLEEIGPFTYIEVMEKRIEDWSEDKSEVSYRTFKHWYRVESESVSLDSPVTTLDIPQFAAGESVRGKGYLTEWGMSSVIGFRSSLFRTRPARDWIFEGFSDSLLTMGSFLTQSTDIPMDKFGWFYKRNGTGWADGVIKMASGAGDYSKLGEILDWNGSNRTHYPGACGEIKGVASGFMPMNRDLDHFDFFSPDICKPIRFQRTEDYLHRGSLPVSKFSIIPHQTFGNVSTNPDNHCFHANMPTGVHNSTGCKDEGIMPVFVSLPHFLGADPVYLDQFQPGSMNPDPEKHSASMTYQLNVSIPVEVKMRLQIMMQIRPNSALGKNWKDLPETFLPVIWFDAQAKTNKEMDSQIWWLVNIVHIVSMIGLCCLVLGSLVILFGIYLAVNHKLKRSRAQPIPTSDEIKEVLEPL